MRDITKTQNAQDKSHEPDIDKVKWKHAETMAIGSTNKRGMRDPVKKEEIIVHMKLEHHRCNAPTRQGYRIPVTKSEKVLLS